MTWYYENKEFNLDDYTDQKLVGFVYCIIDVMTCKQYIGKKIFYNTAYKQIKGKRKRYKKQSDWQEYYGSSADLLADIEKLGVNRFRRRILYLCYSKSEMSYLESKEIFARDAIISEKYYNSWISCKIHGKNVKSLLTN